MKSKQLNTCTVNYLLLLNVKRFLKVAHNKNEVALRKHSEKKKQSEIGSPAFGVCLFLSLKKFVGSA